MTLAISSQIMVSYRAPQKIEGDDMTSYSRGLGLSLRAKFESTNGRPSIFQNIQDFPKNRARKQKLQRAHFAQTGWRYSQACRIGQPTEGINASWAILRGIPYTWDFPRDVPWDLLPMAFVWNVRWNRLGFPAGLPVGCQMIYPTRNIH